MNANVNTTTELGSVAGENSMNDEIKIVPKPRVTFQIGFDDKDEFYDDGKKTSTPRIIDEEGFGSFEKRGTDRFKRKVSELMQNKETLNKLVRESPKNDLENDFGTVAKHLLKKSSIYALSQVGHAESPHRKILWMLVLVAGISGCCYEMYHFLTLYFQYPVVINLQVENSQNLEFPAVTICNLNRMRKMYEICMERNKTDPVCSASHKKGLGSELPISERRSVASCSNLRTAVKDENFNNRMKFLTLYSQLDFTKRKAFGDQIDDLIESCSFNGVQCSLDYFTYFQSLKYGNCFTFNKRTSDNDTILKTSSVGVLNGLDLILNFDPENYLPVTSSIGARVIIHHPQEDPNPDEEGVNISPGFETTLAMKQTCVSRLPAPFKDRCVSYGKDVTVKGNNRNECVRLCIQEQNYARCSCIDPTLPSLKSYAFCNMTNIEEACCLDDTLDLMITDGLPCECPLSCFSVTYDMRMSIAIWPSGSSYFDSYCDWCTHKDELQTIRQKKSRLKISYSTLERKIYEQKAMFQDSELFSHLGGQLGLWLGLSLVAAFELLENVLYIFRYCTALSSCSKRG